MVKMDVTHVACCDVKGIGLLFCIKRDNEGDGQPKNKPYEIIPTLPNNQLRMLNNFLSNSIFYSFQCINNFTKLYNLTNFNNIIK